MASPMTSSELEEAIAVLRRVIEDLRTHDYASSAEALEGPLAQYQGELQLMLDAAAGG